MRPTDITFRFWSKMLTIFADVTLDQFWGVHLGRKQQRVFFTHSVLGHLSTPYKYQQIYYLNGVLIVEDYRNFLTQLLQRGISRKNRFRVTIPLPPGIFDSNATLSNDGNAYPSSSSFGDLFKQSARIVNAFFGGTNQTSRSLQMMCMVASLPGTGIDTTPMTNNGNHIKMPNNKTNVDLELSFLLANDYYEKSVMDKWKNLIFDPYTTKMGYYEDFVTDICIEQMDTEDQVVHRVYVTEAHPINFSSIDLDKSAADQFNQYNISFSYNKVLSETEYETRSLASDFLPLGIADALASGDWETAASKAGQLYKKIKEGNFTGEALLAYKQLDQLVNNLAGISLADFERISIGIQRDILGNDNLTASEKSSLLGLLQDVVKN
ncbi:tail tube protein [Salmonella phage SeF3a]|nr:putative baseplate tail tube [Salmonella phage AR2819]UYL83682.1 baseplate tail tube [Salmonella phage Guerrero]WDS51187.1 tail tube protein [Salmonella phage SeF3a]